MSSSYSDDLVRGCDRPNSDKLQQAYDLIDTVADTVADWGREHSSPEDAAADGAFVERLRIAAGLLEEYLPPRNPNTHVA